MRVQVCTHMCVCVDIPIETNRNMVIYYCSCLTEGSFGAREAMGWHLVINLLLIVSSSSNSLSSISTEALAPELYYTQLVGIHSDTHKCIDLPIVWQIQMQQ